MSELETAIDGEMKSLDLAISDALSQSVGAAEGGELKAYPQRLTSLRESYNSLKSGLAPINGLLYCPKPDGKGCYERVDTGLLRDQVHHTLFEAKALREQADRLSSVPRRYAGQIEGGSLREEVLQLQKLLDTTNKALPGQTTVLSSLPQETRETTLPRTASDVEALASEWAKKAGEGGISPVAGESRIENMRDLVQLTTGWNGLVDTAEQIDDGAREIERLVLALQPPEVDCWALQEDSTYQDRYVVVFDEATGTLHEPPRYQHDGEVTRRVRDLYGGQEVVLCIAGEDLSNRYVVTRGNASVGEQAVLDALSLASTASLRTGAGSVEIPADSACDEDSNNKGEADDAPDAGACRGMLAQARELDRMIELIASARDSLGARLVGDSSNTMRRRVIEPLSTAATPICLGPEGAEDVFPVYRVFAASDASSASQKLPLQEATFDIDGTRGCAERLPASALLSGSTFTWNDGTWNFDTSDALPLRADGKVSLARSVRDKVQASLEKAVEEYDKVVALAMNYRKHALRRNVLFNLGTFNENTLLSATLQRNAITFHYGDDGRTLLQQTTATSYAVTRTARDSTHWGVQPGYLVSGLPRREYELVTGSATGAPNELRLRQEDLFHAPALFVNFYMCPQNLTIPLYRRECTGGAHTDVLRYLPSFAVGVPVSPDIVDGNVFVGLGLPYIPYVTFVAGVHLGLVDMAPAGALSVGTSATALDDATFQQLGVAPFISINASAEILGLLFPQLKPAN